MKIKVTLAQETLGISMVYEHGYSKLLIKHSVTAYKVEEFVSICDDRI